MQRYLRFASFHVLASVVGIATLMGVMPHSVNGAVLGVSTASLDTASKRTPEVYRGTFSQTSVAQVLLANNVHLYPEDRISAFPDPALGIGSQVRVFRATPVTIKDATETRLVRTWATTVGSLLAEQRVDVGEKDRVLPALDQPLADSIEITRVKVTQVSKVEPITYTVRYIDDPNMDKGTKTEEQAGQSGSRKKVFSVSRENGVEVSRVLMSQEVTKEPIEQVIRRGTRIVTFGTGIASYYNLPGVKPMTAAHRTLPKGTKVLVTNLDNGKSVIVMINDRGPYIDGRIIDLSEDAFKNISTLSKGLARVKVEKAD